MAGREGSDCSQDQEASSWEQGEAADPREDASIDAKSNGRSIMNRITRQDAFALLRIVFGCIWLLNTWFQAKGTGIIYCSIFLYLMVIYPPLGVWKTKAAE